MVGFFSTAEEVAEEHVIEVDGPQRAPKKSGIPETGFYKGDKSSLFPNKLHGTNEEQCDTLTSFFVRRSVYFAFFGKLDRIEHERPERERLAREEQERPSSRCNYLGLCFKLGNNDAAEIEIHFTVKERGNARSAGSLWVDPSDTEKLQRVVRKYMRKRTNVCDKNGRLIKIRKRFEDAIADGENTLYLIPTQEYGNAEFSSISRSVSDPQPNSTSRTNVASNAESGKEDLESGSKKKRATITSPIPVEDPLQL
ncbi:uncharacterized protein BDZ99DRAFT_479589 [Mytilinidion resinicola]|uniref:Uncharacterized protein n=1 Tax=Mytilinidion resinicola TaxID=574789 RepID=A0A6A6YBX5_9PEZI|nr:uncharacterized protein BDZ99DRAFT_479589 [Mytilinidion resinicola]KAF2806321.1 hypothetical protein BDZ99DRAFT_479589 [Mytilinidion resinicola]